MWTAHAKRSTPWPKTLAVDFQLDVANRDLASNRTVSDNHAAKARSALVSSTIPRSDSITLPRGASRVAQ